MNLSEVKSVGARRYWDDVRAGRKPPPRRGKGVPNGRRRPLAERFWEKVRKAGPDDCWLFTAGKRAGEYGLMSNYKKKELGGEVVAHRIAWVLTYGPTDLMVLHRCDVPLCCNPAHLFLGTNQDNMTDMVAKGRSLRGSKSPVSKLTESDVLTIRRLYKEGWSQQRIADQYGVHQTCIGFIIRRVSWSHVP